MVPGVDKLIEWYIREGSFLARLKKLDLSWGTQAEGDMHFGVFESLLHHCMGSLEDLTLTVSSSVNKGPLMEKIVDNGMLPHLNHAIQTNGILVVLSSLPNLRRIMWEGFDSGLFHIAAIQLCLTRKPCKLEEIIFQIYGLRVEKDESSEDCRMIEEALTSDNFPSLRSVQLCRKIPSDYFPILQSRKLLVALE